MSLQMGVEDIRPSDYEVHRQVRRLHAFSALSVRVRGSLVVPVKIAMDAGKPSIRPLQNSRVFRLWPIASVAAGGGMNESHQLRLTPRYAR